MIDALDKLSARIDELQDRLTLALEAGGIGIWDWTIEVQPDGSLGGPLIWDRQMFMIFQPTWKTDDYTMFASCLVPEDAGRALKLLTEAIEKRESYDFVYRLQSRPGVTVRGRGKCYYNARGEPYRFVGVCLEAAQCCRGAPVTIPD